MNSWNGSNFESDIPYVIKSGELENIWVLSWRALQNRFDYICLHHKIGKKMTYRLLQQIRNPAWKKGTNELWNHHFITVTIWTLSAISYSQTAKNPSSSVTSASWYTGLAVELMRFHLSDKSLPIFADFVITFWSHFLVICFCQVFVSTKTDGI